MRNIFKEAIERWKLLKALDEENKNYQKELEHIDKQHADLRAKLSANINELQKILQNGANASKLQKLQQENEKLEKEIAVLKEQLLKLTDKINSIKKRVEKI